MYAPDDYENISMHVKSKSPEEIEAYSLVFMKRMKELPDFARIKRNLDSTAKMLEYKKRAP